MTQEDDDIPETGAVFTFGKSRFADNTPNKFWIRNDQVTAVACGDDHSAFVTENGRLYSFGANEWGQLGLGYSKSTTKPSSVKALKQEGVQSVACGRLHTLVLSKAGRLYTFGAGGEGQLGHGDLEGSEIPKQVQSFAGQTIKQMSCGTDHSFLLTDAGLFSWGGGAEGQLGLGDTLESALPQELSISYKVTQVSCGYYHTALITEEGSLYTFGENDMGKLGLGENFTGSTNTPTQVTGIDGPVHSVSCGNNHTAVITGDQVLYTFGEGSQGQLGLGPTILQTSTPTVVTKLRKHRCRTVCCGESHTAVITEGGSLYTFGDGRHGKLGQGEESFSNLFIPTHVRRFKGFHVAQVACGGCHTLVRARRRVPGRDPDSSESESEVETGEDGVDASRLGDNLKRIADSIEMEGTLNGSLGGTARGRRRQREVSPLPPLARTLPPLGSSTPVTKTKVYDTFSHQMIPTIPSAADKDSKLDLSPSDSTNPIKRTEESEDSSYEESEGGDEVDGGTPGDEALDRTYFSRSGNRSDMKRMGSLKRKSKKDTADTKPEEDKTTAPQTAVEKLQPGSDKAMPSDEASKPPAVPKGESKVDDPREDESDDDDDDDSEEDDDDDDDEEESDDESDTQNGDDENRNQIKSSHGMPAEGISGGALTKGNSEKDAGDLAGPASGAQGQGDGASKNDSGEKNSTVKAEEKKSWQFWKKTPPSPLEPPDGGSSMDPPDKSGDVPQTSQSTKVSEEASKPPPVQPSATVDASKSSKACIIL